MTAASVRKTVAAVLSGAALVAGEILNASLVHGDAARWLSLGIAAVGSIVAAISVYTVPNGATITQRVQALEDAGMPAVKDLAQDLHAGLSGSRGQWPTVAPEPVVPWPTPSPVTEVAK